jgi:signal peptide peptidase SppA
MSDLNARAAMERMNLREVAIAPLYSTLAADLQKMAAAQPEVESQKFMDQRRAELCEAYGFGPQEQRKPFAFADGVAVIPVSGSLINRFGQSYGFVTGYNFIRRQLAQAMGDDDVKGIILDVNSYGGEAAGCFELSAEIREARDTKPIVAVVDSNAYSAAYAIASAASQIVCTPSGGVGSIGVVAMHVNFEKMLSNDGVEVTFIHFGDHKVDGNPYEALSPAVKKQIQKSVDKSGEDFVNLVATNRGIDAQVVRDTQAATYRAEEAKSLGLIDTIASPSQALQVFFGELSGSTTVQTEKEDNMSEKTEAKPGATETAKANETNAASLEQAKTEARVAERARITGITGSEEAKGRSELANHLAMNTELSVDLAKSILAAAPLVTEAPKKEAPAADNPFKAAMDNGKHPNVGADANATGKTENAAAEILKMQQAATGVKHD